MQYDATIERRRLQFDDRVRQRVRLVMLGTRVRQYARLLVLGMLSATAGCSMHRVTPGVGATASPIARASTVDSPSDGTLDARTLAVYRTVADSVYVRATQRTVAVLTIPLDTACAPLAVGSLLAGSSCEPLADRWAIGALQWSGADAAEAASVRANWLANSGRALDLSRVPAGWPYLVSIEPADAPTRSSDLQDWASFRDANGYAAGAVRFSSVGFGKSGRTALVAVEWRCGPTCGHTLSAALIATSDSTWRVDNMVLISSMQR